MVSVIDLCVHHKKPVADRLDIVGRIVAWELRIFKGHMNQVKSGIPHIDPVLFEIGPIDEVASAAGADGQARIASTGWMLEKLGVITRGAVPAGEDPVESRKEEGGGAIGQVEAQSRAEDDAARQSRSCVRDRCGRWNIDGSYPDPFRAVQFAHMTAYGVHPGR